MGHQHLPSGDNEMQRVLKPEQMEGLYNNVTEPILPPMNTNIVTIPTVNSNSGTFQRQFQFYIGNLTWWTTDEDILSAARCCGVENIIDIKFAENRQNGQSRGFATVIVENEADGKTLMEQLPTCQMNGIQVIVLPFNSISLQQLEEASKGYGPPDKKQKNPGFRQTGQPQMIVNDQMNMFNQQMQMGYQQMMGGQMMGGQFFPQMGQVAPSAYVTPQAYPSLANMNQIRHDGPSQVVPQAEHEQIMDRNRIVSSAAIARANKEVVNGDIALAISTLNIAISLVRKSKVSDTDPCKELIKTLEDTLENIESKHGCSSRKRRRHSSSDSSPRRRSSYKDRSPSDSSPRRSSRDIHRSPSDSPPRRHSNYKDRSSSNSPPRRHSNYKDHSPSDSPPRRHSSYKDRESYSRRRRSRSKDRESSGYRHRSRSKDRESSGHRHRSRSKDREPRRHHRTPPPKLE